MKSLTILLSAAMTGFLAGCEGDGISVYDIPKEKPQAHHGAPRPRPEPMPSTGSDAPEASGTDLTWKAPAGWVSQGASGMRLASFQVPGPGGEPADLSVTAFPGPAGGDLANVNRWRGQVGLELLDDAGLAKASTGVASPAGRILVVDFTGTVKGKSVRLAGGVLAHGGKTWFFKLMGDGPVVGAAKSAFVTFLGTVHAK